MMTILTTQKCLLDSAELKTELGSCKTTSNIIPYTYMYRQPIGYNTNTFTVYYA